MGGGVINLDQIPVVVVAGTPLLGCLVLSECPWAFFVAWGDLWMIEWVGINWLKL